MNCELYEQYSMHGGVCGYEMKETEGSRFSTPSLLSADFGQRTASAMIAPCITDCSHWTMCRLTNRSVWTAH